MATKSDHLFSDGDCSSNSGHKLSSIGEEESDKERYLAFKSGFISLRERINDLKERQERVGRIGNTDCENQRKAAKQFATLTELFSTKFKDSNPNQSGDADKMGRFSTRKSKIPVMKLNKDDWNVRCWEERLRTKRKVKDDLMSAGEDDKNFRINNLRRKFEVPKQQVEVFHERIEDVAQKLERVREGLPQDMELYQLTLNKAFVGKDEKFKSSHEWTDLLKQELAKGTHNPRRFKQSPNSSLERRRRFPLGRPIGKLFADDEDEDEDAERGGGRKEVGED